jgi:hypothetical protein
VAAGNNALAIASTGVALADDIRVYIKDDGSAVTLTTVGTLTGFTEKSAGISRKDNNILLKGFAAAEATGGAAKLKVGSVTVTVPKDDKGSATGLTATVGTAVIVPQNGGTAYALASNTTSGSTIVFTAPADPNPATVDWKASSGNANGSVNLSDVFDADLIAVLGALAVGDKFVVTNNTTTFTSISFLNTTAPTVANLQKALDNSASVTLGVATTIDATKTVTIPAGVTLGIATTKTLTVSGTLAIEGIFAFADNGAVLIIQAGGEVTGTAAAAFHAKAGATTGASLSLTVAAVGDLTTPTGCTSSNATAPASVVLTTGTAASGSGATAYVLGNASFAINNSGTTVYPVTPIVSTAASASAAAGGIKAGTGSAIKIIGSA